MIRLFHKNAMCDTSFYKKFTKTDISLYEIHKFEQNFSKNEEKPVNFDYVNVLYYCFIHLIPLVTIIEYFVRICDGGGENGKWKEERFPRERARVPARSVGRVQISSSQSRHELRDQSDKALGLPAQLLGRNTGTAGRLLSISGPNDPQQVASKQFETVLPVSEINGAGTTDTGDFGILSRIRWILRGSKFVIIST